MNERIPQVPPVIAALDANESRPLWSVMIPSYNCIRFLRFTLESILAQDPGKSKMQIEVVDDCSTDGDVGALVDEIGKGRIAFYRQDINKGSLRNFETCINRSTGKLVHLLHGDDAVKVGFYAEIEALFYEFPEIGAAYARSATIDEKGNEEREWAANLFPPRGIVDDFLARIAGFQQLQPPSMVVKRSVYERLGSFFAVDYGEDWEMWVRIAAHFPVAYSPKCLARYRYFNATSITYRSVEAGQNVEDIIKIIDIFQNHLPADHQKRIRGLARRNYSRYCANLAHAIYYDNPQSAFVQIRGALKMSKDYKVLYLALKLYVKHLINFKKIRNLWIKDV